MFHHMNFYAQRRINVLMHQLWSHSVSFVFSGWFIFPIIEPSTWLSLNFFHFPWNLLIIFVSNFIFSQTFHPLEINVTAEESGSWNIRNFFTRDNRQQYLSAYLPESAFCCSFSIPLLLHFFSPFVHITCWNLPFSFKRPIRSTGNNNVLLFHFSFLSLFSPPAARRRTK